MENHSNTNTGETDECPFISWKDYNPEDADESEARDPVHYSFNDTYPESSAKTVMDVGSTRFGKWARLRRHHKGSTPSSGGFSTRMSQWDKKWTTEGFSGYLDLTKCQTEEAVRIMLELNLDRFGNQKRVAKVALAVIKIVVNRERFERLQNPNATRISQEPAFKQLMNDHEVTGKDLYSVSQLVKKELKRRGYYNQ